MEMVLVMEKSTKGRYEVSLVTFLVLITVLALLISQTYKLYQLKVNGPIPTVEWSKIDSTIHVSNCKKHLVFAVNPDTDKLELACPR